MDNAAAEPPLIPKRQTRLVGIDEHILTLLYGHTLAVLSEIRHRGVNAAFKSFYLAIQEAPQNWSVIHHWKPALQTFLLLFGEE